MTTDGNTNASQRTQGRRRTGLGFIRAAALGNALFRVALALVAGSGAAAWLAPLHASHPIEMAAGAQVEIEFITHLENSPPSGWLPVGFKIVNRAPQSRAWRVRFESDVGSNSNQLGEWTLSAPGNETREFHLFLPQPWFANANPYSNIRGHISGPGVANGAIRVDRNFNGGNQTSYTGMSHALAAENWSRLEAELDPTITAATPTGSSYSSATFALAGSRINPATLPADWRSWSGFATVWLLRDDWIGLTSVQRLAVMRWVAQGGHLYLAGSGGGLDDLPQLTDAAMPGGGKWKTGALGFGLVARVPVELEGGGSPHGPRLPIAEVAILLRSTPPANPALARLHNEISATEAELTLGSIRPGGPILGLLIAVIAILLGPVNLFLLAPAHRRARLFVSVPLISLGGAVALVALILLQDGTGGRGQRGVLVTLMPDRPEALVLQEQCAMTGLLFDREFPLPDGHTLVDYTDGMSQTSYHVVGRRSARSGLHRAGLHIRGDWFTSRTVHAHHLRAFVPTRAALTLTASTDDAAPTAVSTCPGILRDVIVTDRKGRKWWAAEVPPGRSVVLEPAGPIMVGRWGEQLSRFGVSLAATVARVEPPLSFHASADSWDESVPVPTLPSIRWRGDTILVTGPVREARP